MYSILKDHNYNVFMKMLNISLYLYCKKVYMDIILFMKMLNQVFDKGYDMNK